MKEWDKGGQREDRDSKLGEQEGRRKKKSLIVRGGSEVERGDVEG